MIHHDNCIASLWYWKTSGKASSPYGGGSINEIKHTRELGTKEQDFCLG